MDSKVKLSLLLTCLLWFCLCSEAEGEELYYPGAWKLSGWAVQTSFHTWHFDPDPEHNNDQNLFSAEAVFQNRWLFGAAFFSNSFDQASQFIYAGKTWRLFHSRNWYAKLRGGLIHGYSGEYKNKIPFNNLGVAPAIVPAIGFKYRSFVMEAHLGGLAAMTFTAGARF